MQTTVPSFAILDSGHAVILDSGGQELDVLPKRLTRPLLALLASANSTGEGFTMTPAGEELS